MATDFRIVTAEPRDLDRYLDLLEEVSRWLDSRQVRQWQPGVFRQCGRYFAASIQRREVHLVLLDGALAGTLRLLPGDPDVWPEITGDDGVYLYNLVVRRAWAGQGLGRRMLRWAERRTAALGRAWLRLDCFADNDRLRHYYEEAGFVERGEVVVRYPEPVGVLRLRRFEKDVRGRRDSPPGTEIPQA